MNEFYFTGFQHSQDPMLRLKQCARVRIRLDFCKSSSFNNTPPPSFKQPLRSRAVENASFPAALPPEQTAPSPRWGAYSRITHIPIPRSPWVLGILAGPQSFVRFQSGLGTAVPAFMSF